MKSCKENRNDHRAILNERYNMTYTLRKKKQQEKNIQARLQEICQMDKIDEILEINPRELHIPSDIKQIYCTSSHEDRLALACRYLQSQQEDIVQFIIYSMRKLSEEYENSNRELFSINVIDSIFSCMLTQPTQWTNNLSLFYEATIILKNITVYSPYFTKVLAENNYLKAIVHIFLQQCDIRIRANIMVILGNILVQMGKVFLQCIEQHCQFCHIVSDYIQRHDEFDYSLGTKTTLFWTMSCIINHLPFEHINGFIDQNVKTFKVIFLSLYSNLNKKLFNAALCCLNNLLNRAGDNDSLIKLIEQIKIYPIIIKYLDYSMPNQCLINLSDIFLSLIYFNQEVVHELYYHNFFANIAIFLNEYSIKRCSSKKNIIMNLFEVLLNCTLDSAGDGNDYVVRKSSVTFSLCEVLKAVNDKDIVKGILKVLLSSLNNCKSDIKCEMIRIEVPELFTTKLTETDDTEIIMLCLKGISEFLSFGASLVKQKNILKELFEALNVSELLEKLIIHQDKDISFCSNRLVQEYFS